MTLEQRIAAERDARLAEKCGELALALAKSNEMIARLTRERDEARAKAYGSIIKLTAEIGALSERATVAEQERDDARAKALEEAAQVADRHQDEHGLAMGSPDKSILPETRMRARSGLRACRDVARAIRALANKDRNDG